MSTQLPPTSSSPVTVSKTYPGVSGVQDPPTVIALRLLHDLLGLVGLKATPTRGTLDPDQRPLLTPLQTGALFYSSDFDRVFKWGGTTWEDAPGQPARGQVGWFQVTSPPGTGWAQCNGAVVQTTSPSATLITLTTPTIDTTNGLLAWIRL